MGVAGKEVGIFHLTKFDPSNKNVLNCYRVCAVDMEAKERKLPVMIVWSFLEQAKRLTRQTYW